MATYTYSILNDTATGAVNADQLWAQLIALAVANPGFPALDQITIDGDDLGIIYLAALSAPQEALLTGAIAAHTPAPPLVPPPTIEDQIRDIDPTVNDDDTLGYEPSVRWLNITSEEEYVCTDSATGAAVWKLTTGSAGPPLPHAASHENGGADEISVAGLSGTLADAQTPAAHAASHLSTGSDPIAEFAGAAPASDGLDGLVTKPLAGEQRMFLRGDGSWQTIVHEIDIEDAGTPIANTPHTTLNFSGFTVADAGGGTVDITAAGGSSVFGEDYQIATSLARSTTSSNSFQTKLTLTTPVLTGTYRIEWMGVVDQSNTQDSVEARLINRITGSNVGVVQRIEPKDTDNRMFVGGIHNEVFSAETKSFSIQWRQQDGSTAAIANAVIELWRVS